MAEATLLTLSGHFSLAFDLRYRAACEDNFIGLFRTRTFAKCQHQRQTRVEQSFGIVPWVTHGFRSKP